MVFRLTLPGLKRVPFKPKKQGKIALVPVSVGFRLWPAEVQLGFWKPCQTAFRVWMLMPKTSVDKYYLPAGREDQIW